MVACALKNRGASGQKVKNRSLGHHANSLRMRETFCAHLHNVSSVLCCIKRIYIYIYINSFSTQAHPDIPNAFGNLFMEMALGGWEISGSVFACVLLLCSGPCKLAETQQRICFPPAGMAGVVSVRVGLSPGALGRQNELCRHGGPRHLNHCS